MTDHARNEAETRAELIDPALADAGWRKVAGSRVGREVITLGRLEGAGRRGKQDIADYVLIYRGQKLAVIEAKKESAPVTEGLAQAKRYAERLQARFAYSTNGVGLYRADLLTGSEGDADRYLTPDELWAEVFAEQNAWRERFGAVPYEDRGGDWQPRYYQHNAINQVLEAVADGRDRILLTMATGTGKTAVAFQIAWKLFHSRWNLKDWRGGSEPSRRPRILFLADRNILADQAFNAFNAFQEDALVRIAPEDIRKKNARHASQDKSVRKMQVLTPSEIRSSQKRLVPKNASVFFTIFQTFMTGRDENGEAAPYFGDYPPKFFDLIIIDECHRGGANDESNWRGILEYFAPAVQLGLTATPKRKNNADTYLYFGEPVYTYSLKDGINDGYLTPFKVRQIQTTLDEYVYTSDDDVVEGDIEQGKRYTEEDFNRIIEIKEREKYRVRLFMEQMDQREKTLVFCATQDHALAVRDLVNQMKSSKHPDYCVRVTANDGAEGERFLKTFQDNEKTIPTILTTSQKLSTGVDARNVRNIVLLRPINSMIEFKQIIGRGTRLYDGKDYFTIYDFVRAHEHFNDPEWDGEPIEPEECVKCGHYPCTCIVEPPEPCAVCGEEPCVCPAPPPEPCDVCGELPCVCRKRPKRIKIKLADGKERQLQNMQATTFWSPDGKPMSAAEFIERLFGTLPELFRSEDELRELWGDPTTRRRLMEGLGERGYTGEQLGEIAKVVDAERSDVFDVLAYVAYAKPTMTRQERVAEHRAEIHATCNDKQRVFLDFVLDHYIEQGVGELDADKLPQLLELQYHALADAVRELGAIAEIKKLFVGFQRYLYRRRA